MPLNPKPEKNVSPLRAQMIREMELQRMSHYVDDRLRLGRSSQ